MFSFHLKNLQKTAHILLFILITVDKINVFTMMKKVYFKILNILKKQNQ